MLKNGIFMNPERLRVCDAGEQFFAPRRMCCSRIQLRVVSRLDIFHLSDFGEKDEGQTVAGAFWIDFHLSIGFSLCLTHDPRMTHEPSEVKI